MILHHPRLAGVTVTVADDKAHAWLRQGWTDPAPAPVVEPEPEPVEDEYPDLD